MTQWISIRFNGTVLLAMTLLGLSGAWGQEATPATPPPAAMADDKDVVVVEVEGEGSTKDEALRIALRAALERGGQQEIFSDTKVENYQLIHDTILSRAQGIVKDYQVLSEKQIIGGTWRTRIKANVSKSVLATNWGEVQNVLKQIGRPKILVWINERIDKQLEEQSILETRIEEALLKSGFDLVDRKAVESARQKELADAAAENNVAKLQSLAKGFNAHIFIAGTANADAAGLKDLYGEPTAFYNCDVQLKMYYTDTGKLLASKGIPNTRGGARGCKEHSPQAGKTALAFAGENVVEQIYEQVMEQWATAISAGGELVLEMEGIKTPQALKLKKAIAELKGVENVNMDLTKGTATYRINAKMSAEDLAMRLSDGDFAKLLEITDIKLNRLQGKMMGDSGQN